MSTDQQITIEVIDTPSENAPSSVEETPSSVEETPSSIETTPSSVEETPSSVEETPSSVETTPSSDETTPSVEDTPSSDETTPSSDETTPSSVEETPSVEDTPSVEETPSIETTPSEEPIVDPRTIPHQITIEYIEPPPNPIVEIMKQHSKIALLVGLNYVDFPEITLKTRIQSMNNAKQILINFYGFVEENILVLIEPSRENVLSMLNIIIGSSSFTNEIIIYYSGYGNGIMKTDLGFCAEPGIIDNLAKQIMPADFAEIGQDELMSLLNQTCCKTVCIMDMCPYGNEEMLLKWSADVNNNIKVITLCESDSHNTNKNQLIQSMLQNYLQIVRD